MLARLKVSLASAVKDVAKLTAITNHNVSTGTIAAKRQLLVNRIEGGKRRRDDKSNNIIRFTP
jgi:hypothetical protein